MPGSLRPPGASRADLDLIDLLSNRARAVICRELSRQGPLRTAELHAVVGGDRVGLTRHLRTLEDAGLIGANYPRGRRNGRTVIWHVVARAVEAHQRAMTRYLLARDD